MSRWLAHALPRLLPPAIVGLWALAFGAPLHAATGADAWLAYAPPPNARAMAGRVPARVLVRGDDPVMKTAGDELAIGLGRMLGRPVERLEKADGRPAVWVGIEGTMLRGPMVNAEPLTGDAFRLSRDSDGYVVVGGATPRGALYGAFALLRRVALGDVPETFVDTERPSAPLRWVNEWNNLDGTIERGYAGRSIFFADGHVVPDLSRAKAYARLLASVGINGCTINNVNADTRLLTDAYLPELVRVAEAFRPWGVKLSISVDFSSPRKLGGLDTFDPLDPRVATFWKQRVDAIYGAIPDFGGFTLKADSEGRLGPSAYGRTHADAANVIARALAPHGGVIFYRGFVYDHHMDWRNPKNDRARAAYDNFKALDGQFEPNVVLQIKHGPIDFQVREPASPLFAALPRTNQVIELQVTQEYTGQQRHVVYLGPMWQEVLDFEMQAESGSRGSAGSRGSVGSRGSAGSAGSPGSGGSTGSAGARGRLATPVKALVTGATFDRPLGGFVAVVNVGQATNWLAHDLAMANLYVYGRLAWVPWVGPRARGARSDRAAEDWVRLTFGHDPLAAKTITGILNESWRAYELYTGPLGGGGLTDIIEVHYGPGIESSERNGWGQWHRADDEGMGMDRTVATGTGYIGQYPPPVAAMYESLATCPDELLLFMHHVPYTHVLHSGKTVIQHIYDTHYEGAEMVSRFVRDWRALKGRIDDARYEAVLARLEYQAGHAVVWRDAIVQWFRKTSGIPDTKGRSEGVPGRVEAEDAQLSGYVPVDVTPWETASEGKAVSCAGPAACTLSVRNPLGSGVFDVHVLYYDERDGSATFRLRAGDRVISEWTADDDLPTKTPNGHSATRVTFESVRLEAGQVLTLEGAPGGEEQAVVDYVELAKR
jgi:alpha-glucuronidase